MLLAAIECEIEEIEGSENKTNNKKANSVESRESSTFSSTHFQYFPYWNDSFVDVPSDPRVLGVDISVLGVSIRQMVVLSTLETRHSRSWKKGLLAGRV